MNNDWITRLSEYVATGEGIAWIVGLVAVPSAVWTVRTAPSNPQIFRKIEA